MGKQKTKKTFQGDSWLDPPKSEKPKHQKNLGKTKKTNSQRLLAGPPFPQDFPRFFLLFWFSQGFFGFLILLILGGPSKSLSELFLCFLKGFWFSI